MSTTADNTTIIPLNKTTAALTPEQQVALLLKQLDKQKRSTLGDFALGKIKSWDDYTSSSGLAAPPALKDTPITYALVKQAFDIKILAVKAGESLLERHHDNLQQSNAISLVKTEDSFIDKQEAAKELDDEFTVIDCLRNNPQILYNKHQEKAASDILRALCRDNKHSLGLNARVGAGKTYILGAVLHELWERQWQPLMESISLYPVVYITRATVVEQTERVLFKEFGLRRGHQCDVTNIDQMRSRFGENFVKERIVVEHGEEHIVYEWYEPLAPALIILDESQCVKNIESTQSRIMQAYNDLPVDKHYQIHSSATMFTRVIESKVMAVGTRLEW